MTKRMDKSLMINKVNPCKYTRVVYTYFDLKNQN